MPGGQGLQAESPWLYWPSGQGRADCQLERQSWPGLRHLQTESVLGRVKDSRCWGPGVYSSALPGLAGEPYWTSMEAEVWLLSIRSW